MTTGVLAPDVRARTRALVAIADDEDGAPGLDAMALRLSTAAMRDLFAAKATDGALSAGGLVDLAHGVRGRAWPELPSGLSLDGDWLARLARVVALQFRHDRDVTDALALYGLAHDRCDLSNLDPVHAKLFADLLLEVHDDRWLRQVLPSLRLAPDDLRAVRADLANPHRGGPTAVDEPRWRRDLVRAARFPEGTRLAPTDGGGRPFDRLEVRSPSPAATATTLVTVVMNVFRPDRALLSSVRSLLAQTWDDLEILMVDDGSGPAFAPVFAEAEALDPRVELVRLARNRGAYGARNAALERARGTFVTFQDYDDWSHPARIAHQAMVMLDEPGLMATRCRATKLHDDLTLLNRGYRRGTIHAASLFFRRREVLLGIGWFDPARKAADNEYRARIAAHFGPGACAEDARSDPSLMAYRLTAGSLSRDEFRPGWRHPARAAYRNAYLQWHDTTPPDGLFLGPDDDRRFPAPARFLGHDEEERHLDVVVLADVRPIATHVEDAVAVVGAAVAQGRAVGLAALEAPTATQVGEVGIHPALQAWVNAGQLDLVVPTSPASTDRLVVVDPGVLLFADTRPGWSATRAWVVERGGGDRDVVDTIRSEAEARLADWWGAPVTWLPDTAAAQRFAGSTVDA